MHVQAIKTHLVQSDESLENILDHHLLSISEKTILVITSKIISICQGRILPKTSVSKEALIKQEADAVVQMGENPYGIYLTLKNNILIPSAGIDESNGDDVYILYPKDVQNTAIALWNYLRQRHSLEHLGIIILIATPHPCGAALRGLLLDGVDLNLFIPTWENLTFMTSPCV